MTMEWQIALGIAAIGLVVAVAAFIAGRLTLRDVARHKAALEAQVADHEQRLANLEREFNELRRGSQGMVRHIRDLRQQLQSLGERQEQIAYQDPEARLYNRAVKLLEQGAGLEEIMESCELPRAEAELLIRIHGRG